MAKEIQISEKELTPGIFDSDTGKELKAEKIVDVTEECPLATEAEKSIFVYTKAQRGPIVYMKRSKKGKLFGGSGIHFFIHDLDEEVVCCREGSTFGNWAASLGFSKKGLKAVIEKHAPKF